MVALPEENEEERLPVTVGSGPETRAVASTDTFDVRVIAWANPGEGTVAALQQLFGVDEAMAQRLVQDVPVIVKRGASYGEAEQFVLALSRIGGQVSIDPSGSTPVALPESSAPSVSRPTSIAPHPPPERSRAEAPASLPRPPARRPPNAPLAVGGSMVPKPSAVPRPPSGPLGTSVPASKSMAAAPRARATPRPGSSRVPSRPISQDMSLDLIGNDGRSNGRSVAAKAPRVRNFDDAEEAEGSRRAVKRGARGDFDMSALGGGGDRLALAYNEPAPAASPPIKKPTSQPSRPVRANSGSLSQEPHPPSVSSQEPAPKPLPSTSATEASAPRVRPPPEPAAARKKMWLIVFSRLVFGLAVAAGGLFVDDTILRGNATPLSLFLHAMAIYQFGLGVRGVLR